MFSGGSYDEVERWVRVFLTSHAKREHPRVEVVLDEDEVLRGLAFRARLRLGERVSAPMELEFKDVAAGLVHRPGRPHTRAGPQPSRRWKRH